LQRFNSLQAVTNIVLPAIKDLLATVNLMPLYKQPGVLMKSLFMKTVFILVATSLLLGCATGRSKSDELHTVTVKITTTGDVNKNLDGEPSPTVIVLYQLVDIDLFNSADFFNLYQNPKTVLNNELIDQRQIIVTPNQPKTVTLQINNGTQYLGVLAAFNDITNSQWRQTVKVERKKSIIVDIQLAGSQVSIKQRS
jgi:type VI secretion system protein VasD